MFGCDSFISSPTVHWDMATAIKYVKTYLLQRLLIDSRINEQKYQNALLIMALGILALGMMALGMMSWHRQKVFLGLKATSTWTMVLSNIWYWYHFVILFAVS